MSLVSDHDMRTLVRMIEVMFPHGSFPPGPYERAAREVLDAAETNPRSLAQLCQGLHDLDRLRDAPFAQLDDAVALTVLRGIQDAPFFVAVHSVASVRFYDDHEVWELLGYEGPSFAKGGYVERGFDDLDWLPEPRVEEVSR